MTSPILPRRRVARGLLALVVLAGTLGASTAPAAEPGDFRVDAGFVYGTNGGLPRTTLLHASDGRLYGGTRFGVGASYDCGRLFRFAPAEGLQTVHSFDCAHGKWPSSALVEGQSGELYGTTEAGGRDNRGVVFRLEASGRYQTVDTFARLGLTGSGSTLMRAADGRLYGTTAIARLQGGRDTLFSVGPSGRISVLHEFTGADGKAPSGAPIQAADGALYGVTRQGGAYNRGVLYRWDANGYAVVFEFGVPNARYPSGPLMQGSDGALYGVTTNTGVRNYGTVFRYVPGGAFAILHEFVDNEQGIRPLAPLAQDANGVLYGVTAAGSRFDGGNVFRLDAAGTLTVLNDLPGPDTGPTTGLVAGPQGRLYATTPAAASPSDGGTIFSVMPY